MTGGAAVVEAGRRAATPGGSAGAVHAAFSVAPFLLRVKARAA